MNNDTTKRRAGKKETHVRNIFMLNTNVLHSGRGGWCMNTLQVYTQVSETVFIRVVRRIQQSVANLLILG
jgi:hypothetical protein